LRIFSIAPSYPLERRLKSPISNALAYPAQQLNSVASIAYQRAQELSESELDALWSLVSHQVRAPREVLERGLRAMDEVWLYSVGGILKGFGGVPRG
jgi:hypothetical protein